MASLDEITRSRVGNNDAFFNARVAEFKNRGIPGASNGDLVQPGGELAKLHLQWDAEMAAKNPGATTGTTTSTASEKATIGGAIKDFAGAGLSYGYAWAKGTFIFGNILNGIEAMTYRPYKLYSALKTTGLSQQSFKALVDWGVSAVGTALPPVASTYYQAQSMTDGFDAGRNLINAFSGKEKTQTSDGMRVLVGVGGGLLLGKFGGTFGSTFNSVFGMTSKQVATDLFVTNGTIAAKAAAAGVGAGVLGTVLSGIKSLVSSNSAPARATPLPA
jgi:hypothetical protein